MFTFDQEKINDVASLLEILHDGPLTSWAPQYLSP